MAKKNKEIVENTTSSYPFEWLPAWGNVNPEGYYPKRAFWNRILAYDDFYENVDGSGKLIIKALEYIKTPDQLKWFFENLGRPTSLKDVTPVFLKTKCFSWAFVMINANNENESFSSSFGLYDKFSGSDDYQGFSLHSKRLYMFEGRFLRKLMEALNTYNYGLPHRPPKPSDPSTLRKLRFIPLEFLVPTPFDEAYNEVGDIYRDGYKLAPGLPYHQNWEVEKGKFEFYHKDFKPNEQFYSSLYFNDGFTLTTTDEEDKATSVEVDTDNQ